MISEHTFDNQTAVAGSGYGSTPESALLIHPRGIVRPMLMGVAMTSDWVAAIAISVPAAAALGGVWVKGSLDRRSDHRQVRRQSYADFIATSRIVAVRSLRYRHDLSLRGMLGAAMNDAGPLLFSATLLTMRTLRRRMSEAERIGLLGRIGQSTMTLGSTNETNLYEGLEELLRANASLRIVGSESMIEASDAVLDIARRFVDDSSQPLGFSKLSKARMKELIAEFEEAQIRLVRTARKEFPGL
jgi:hypothetical protein